MQLQGDGRLPAVVARVQQAVVAVLDGLVQSILARATASSILKYSIRGSEPFPPGSKQHQHTNTEEYSEP